MVRVMSYCPSIISNRVLDMVRIIEQRTVCIANDKYYEKPPTAIQSVGNCVNLARTQPGIYLHIDNIQKMIHRFLVEKKMSKAGLAKTLKLTTEELDLFYFKKEAALILIPKINLLLIKLYCSTKFNS